MQQIRVWDGDMGMRSKGLKQSEPGERKTKRDAVRPEISQLSVDDKHVITVHKKTML